MGGPLTSDGGGALSTMGGPLGGPGLEPRFNETLNVGVMNKVNSRDDAKPISTKHRRAIQKSIDL